MVNLTRQQYLSVAKPARYVGGEYNQVVKKISDIKIRFAFCFPDIYDIGMCNLGWKILYNILNKRDDTWCERVFAPWIDFEELLREEKIPLYGLESKDAIKQFDFIGFTLQYEMSYTNILNMLDLAGVPIFSEDRHKGDPFVIAGGPCAANPAPMSKFIDIFVIGEAEEIIVELMDKYRIWQVKRRPRAEFLENIKDMQGIYIPSIHTSDNIITKVIVKNIDEVTYPVDFVVPSVEVVQNKVSLEVFRGCSRGCRFCQAGYAYRPVREKTSKKLLELAKAALDSTGINEVSLASLSTSDYSDFNNLANGLIQIGEKKKVGISLPSLRIDSIDLELLKKIQSVRKSSLTFAPEAGTQRLRDVINKNITKEEILSSCKLAFENGWSNIKLYFMIGLPTETMEDLEGIVELANSIVATFYDIPNTRRRGRCNVTVSTSTFVPKPHTPFEWCAQDSIEKIEEKQQFLKDKLKNKSIKYSWHNPKVSMLEAVISRGDEKIADVIYQAYKNGAKFDSWEECLNFEAWEKAFETTKVNISDYANKEYDMEHVFAWDNIRHGVDKEFLKREYIKSTREITTLRCSKDCAGCGITKIATCGFLKIK
ncbi:MAG: TIGR03960 family B12-binding radical SAM protein [Clostridia bacterium]